MQSYGVNTYIISTIVDYKHLSRPRRMRCKYIYNFYYRRLPLMNARWRPWCKYIYNFYYRRYGGRELLNNCGVNTYIISTIVDRTSSSWYQQRCKYIYSFYYRRSATKCYCTTYGCKYIYNFYYRRWVAHGVDGCVGCKYIYNFYYRRYAAAHDPRKVWCKTYKFLLLKIRTTVCSK